MKAVAGLLAVGVGLAGAFAVPDGWLPQMMRRGPAPSGEAVFVREYNRLRYEALPKVKATELRDAGMMGVVAALGDPHSIYFPPDLAKQFTEETRANFFGVGARLTTDPLGAKTVKVFEDGPAYGAGVRDGDVVTRVDGKSVTGKPVDEIVKLIKGPEGETVVLGVVRKAVDKPLQFTIRRARIVTPTVEGKRLDGDVGYLAISQVAEPTAAQFDKELDKLETKPLKGLVIDLRSNGGGLLQVTAEILSRFAENRTVVKMKLKDGSVETVPTYSNLKRRFPYKIAVLQDENTASAAEILAGCLRDYGLATLVGTHTYGKASVQNLFPVRDSAMAKITIAKYYLPGGEFVGRKVDADGVYLSGGLAPTIRAELDLDRDPTFGDPKTDSQLEKAIAVVTAR